MSQHEPAALRRETLLDFFDDLARRDGEFLVYDDGYRIRTFSYAQVAAAAQQFAGKLSAAGLTAGERILLWGENRPEWVVVLWGALLVGVVVVPLDYRGAADFVGRVRSIAGARLLIIGEEVTVPDIDVPVWELADVEWGTPSAAEPMRAAVTRDSMAEVLFTSGATAEPKGVIISHRNILANITPVEGEMRKYLAKYRAATRIFFPIRFLNLLPLSHMFGQAMATFIPPMLAGTVVFMRGYNPQEIVRQIKTRRISVLVSVPKILEVLREYVIGVVPEAATPPPAGEKVARRWWRYRRVHRLFGYKFWSFIVGAAPLDPELEEFWSRLGFLVVQGYGLTETAPIVTLNHPFNAKKGTVGKPIHGVEVKISPEGEILVRGDNVTTGYLNAGGESSAAFADGWLRTGDVGSVDEEGRLQIRGRLKEMIVTSDGLNVFPEDVERVLDRIAGVAESAVVGVRGAGSEERVHAVLVLREGADANAVVREANQRVGEHQRVRGYSVWPGDALPRTPGTRKLKRREVRTWVEAGSSTGEARPSDAGVASLLAKYAPSRVLVGETTLAELGLSSLERVELLMLLEQRFGVAVDEARFASAATVADLDALVRPSAAGGAAVTAPFSGAAEPVEFPRWNRQPWAYWTRRIHLPLWLLPLARVFVWIRREGLENLREVQGPVIFAANHQSHLDVPTILAAMPAKWRYRAAPAMSKEFFRAHFYPQQHSRIEWFTNSLNYYLAALLFNAYPFPQREAGARQTLRYAGELVEQGWCILIFPEGKISENGELGPFMPGVGMMASRLGVPVVPVRIDGLTRVLHRSWRFPRPGRVRVAFGRPMQLEGDDYTGLARRVRDELEKL